MQQDTEFLKEFMAQNAGKIQPLIPYLPWLEEKSGKSASTLYTSDGLGESSVAFPVYDATLMRFVKEAATTELMDRNYPYVYTRCNLQTHEDERRFIEAATWREWDQLCGILSKYVMGGRTRSTLWSEGISESIFYLTVKKMHEIVEFWK